MLDRVGTDFQVARTFADMWKVDEVSLTRAAALRPALRLRRDVALRSLAARGDATAFAVLYERHHQALYRYCRSILGHDEDARDALQSAMTKAFAALRDEERDFELRPWLFRIAHNEAISLLRRRRDSDELDGDRIESRESVTGTVADRERLSHLRTDLLDLPERQRTALVLRELNGLSHSEIAAALECSTRAVKQTIFEARSALHEFEEGRAMACEEVQRRLSDGDGRVLRARRMRAHLRACPSCRRFRSALGQRPADLAAIAPPLPLAASAALLHHLLPGAKATVAAGGASSAGVGGGIAATAATKAVLVVAATAAVAGGATVATRTATHHGPPAPLTPVWASGAAPSGLAGRRSAAAKGHAVVSQRPGASSGAARSNAGGASGGVGSTGGHGRSSSRGVGSQQHGAAAPRSHSPTRRQTGRPGSAGRGRSGPTNPGQRHTGASDPSRSHAPATGRAVGRDAAPSTGRAGQVTPHGGQPAASVQALTSAPGAEGSLGLAAGNGRVPDNASGLSG